VSFVARRAFAIALVLVASAALSWPRFQNQLVWDDVFLMDVAEVLAREGGPARAFEHSTLGLVRGEPDGEQGGIDMYRPLGLVSFWAGYGIDERGPLPQHALNLALHLLCTVLVFALARARCAEHASFVAPLAAAWFSLAPMLAEAHVWISGRFDLLCGFFALLALWVWSLGERRPTRARVVLDVAAGALFLCALLSKEAALMVVVLLPFWPQGEVSWRTRLLRCAPFGVALALYAFMRARALEGGAGLSLEQLPAAALHFGAVVLDAIASLLVPARIYVRLPSEDYAALGTLGLLGCWLAVLALFFGAARLRKQSPAALFGLAWLAALLVPIALVTLEPRPGLGRYLYLPSALFFIGAADVARLVYQRTQTAAARLLLQAALVLQLSVGAYQLYGFTTDLRDEDTLFRSIIAGAPDRSHGYGYYGLTFLERKRFPEAAVLLGEAVELAPMNRVFVAKYGQALLFSRQSDAALVLARKARVRLGDHPTFHLIEAYAQLQSDPAQAKRELEACLRMSPEHEECKAALKYLESLSLQPAAAP
jgi:hypothetical protein